MKNTIGLNGYLQFSIDDLVKSHQSYRDGLWKKFDLLGVVSETAIRQYIGYAESSFQIYNDVNRAFYESISIHDETNASVILDSGCGTSVVLSDKRLENNVDRFRR